MSLRSLCVALTLLGHCGCGSSTTTPAAAHIDTVPVSTARVDVRDVPTGVRAIGTVSAYSTVSLRAQIDGQLAEVRFAEGQQVRRGDLLFVIDSRPFEAALRIAEGQLAKDRAAAAQTAAAAARFRNLAKAGVVSRDEWDRVRASEAGGAAAVQAAAAAVDAARIRLQYCRVVAPIDGRIGAILVHPGNVLKANDTLLAVVNQLRPTYVDFSVPQAELPQVRRRMALDALPVEATVTRGEAPAVGRLSFVDNSVDASTGMVRLKALFDNGDEALWPGQFVDVVLHVETRAGALVIPARAVQVGQDGRFVYVVKPDGTVELRAVQVGASVAEDAVVTSGLAAGETVVTDGQLRLAPGRKVEVKPAGPPDGARPS